MATLASDAEPTITERPATRFVLHDRVSVPGGSIGSVIGFYHRDPETVLVMFESGGSREFRPADLQRIR